MATITTSLQAISMASVTKLYPLTRRERKKIKYKQTKNICKQKKTQKAS
jgi:hypothetical protein